MTDVVSIKKSCVIKTRHYFEQKGRECNAVIGISGGRYSAIAAALCAEALGSDRVIGVLMPNGVQLDIDMAEMLINHLGIRHCFINIKEAVDSVVRSLPFEPSVKTISGIPAQIRMTTLRAVAQRYNGRVVNTSKNRGGFNPLSGLSEHEINQIGRLIGVPDTLIA